MTDKEIGRKVFRSFYDWSRRLYASKFTYSFEEFLNKMQPNKTKLEITFDGLGFGVRSAEVSDSRIDSAMRSLALQSQGRIPANPSSFFNYISNEATKIYWLDAAAHVAKESLMDVAKGAEEIGKSILTTGKILNFLLPAIALIFVFYWVNSKTGGTLGKAVKGLRR